MSLKGWGCLTLPWGCRWGWLEIPRQKGLICMVSFGRRWGEVGRTARNLDRGKPLTPTPPASKFPHTGSQSNTLVLGQTSCWAMNP